MLKILPCTPVWSSPRTSTSPCRVHQLLQFPDVSTEGAQIRFLKGTTKRKDARQPREKKQKYDCACFQSKVVRMEIGLLLEL